MDQAVFEWFNHWSGRSDPFDLLLRILRTNVFKSMPFMMAFWALWFAPRENRTERRESLIAVILVSGLIVAVTRFAANMLPFSSRPVHTPDQAINLYEGQSVTILEGWSSMPSDHASLFLGLAVAILIVNRKVGYALIAWAVFAVSLPRIVIGLHWPSDILVGWLIGAAIALVFMRPLTLMVRRIGLVPFFEVREAIGYPLLFLATFEIAQLFGTARKVLEALS